MYRFNSIKTDEFYENFIKILFVQKETLSEEICEIFKKIFYSINVESLGELGVKTFLSFILKYEEFLRELNVFTCNFPKAPNELIYNLINEYINYFKQKSLKILSPDFMAENWSVFSVVSHHFKDKIYTYLSMNDDTLSFSNMFRK